MANYYAPWFDVLFHDIDGITPLSGGKVYAYYAGTLTEAPTYNENNEANAFPIILDSAGRCQLKLTQSITYDIKVKSSTNSLVRTFENVKVAEAGGSGESVTMDTIDQGTSYKKITTAEYSGLTSGVSTTLHYHSADRQWVNITSKPTTIAGYGITDAFTKTETSALVSAVTMDTISQGSLFKKLSASQYDSLTNGSSTTLHYHSADRVWSNLTGTPTTIAGYGITNAYTKTEVDALVGGYNFTQAYPTNEWTITHNLGYKPVVQTWNSSDDVIVGTIHHVSVNQLTVLFSSGQSGGGRCV